MLGRPPTRAESDSWVQQLMANNGQGTRVNLVATLTVSAEFRYAMARKYYAKDLGRLPTSSEMTAFAARVQAGWSFDYAEADVLASDEFYARQGSTNAGYVRGLYWSVLGIVGDPNAVSYLADMLATGTSRWSMAVSFTTWSQAHDVVAASTAPWLLHRPATVAEVNLWSAQLDGGMRHEVVYTNIVASEEYWSQA
jgi:hypothetical protein